MGSENDFVTSSPKHEVNVFAEAQEAFGMLLLASKNSPPEKPYIRPGTFPFFDLPRELRDLIYDYYLSCPQPFFYRRERAYTGRSQYRRGEWYYYGGQWCFREGVYSKTRPPLAFSTVKGWTADDSSHVTLFMTSPEIYREAFDAFWRCNVLEISAKRELDGILRLFPQKPASSIRRIQLTYRNYIWRRTWRDNTLAGSFAQMITESRLAKQHFPSLVVCICVLDGPQQTDGELFNRSDSGEAEEITNWMRTLCSQQQMQPPPWLTVQSSPDGDYGKSFQSMFAEALERVKKEIASTRSSDLEHSGQRWIEDFWKEDVQNGNRKRWRRRGLTNAFDA